MGPATNLSEPVIGPRDRFEILLPAPREPGAELPEQWAQLVGPWDLPDMGERPYVYVNFMISRDGRASFNEPENYSPLAMSMGHEHDSWLMGLLRARADAVLVGDGTIRADPMHVWRPEYVFPRDRAAYQHLRHLEGLNDSIPLVLISLHADIPATTAQWTNPDAHTILVTTTRSLVQAEQLGKQSAGRFDIVELGDEGVDLRQLMPLLRSRFGIRRLLCEGGPRLYGSLLAHGAVDEEFLTLSPMVLGNDVGSPRPGLVEGVRFDRTTAPISSLVSVLRSGDFLFLRSRYAQRAALIPSSAPRPAS